MKETKLKETIEVIFSYGEQYIKNILWILCYNPKSIFEEYELTGISAQELQEEIIKACKERNEKFIFASEEPKLSSFGINLKIKNPVIRDTVIEHCVNASDDSTYLRWCISKLCTRRDDFEYFIKRREGFDLLEFSQEEQTFLENEMDTYLIGELLKAIQREKFPSANVPIKKKNTFVKQIVPTPIEPVTKKCEEGKSEVKLDSAKLLENEELVKNFIVFFTSLEKVGLDPRNIVNKKDAVERFYKTAASF